MTHGIEYVQLTSFSAGLMTEKPYTCCNPSAPTPMTVRASRADRTIQNSEAIDIEWSLKLIPLSR